MEDRAEPSQLPAIRPVEREVARSAPTPPDLAPALIPTSEELDIIARIGQWAERSGFIKGVTAEGCAIKILAGREYNVGPWQALAGIHIINGAASLGANLIGGLVTRFLRKQGGGEFRVVTSTAEECTVRFRRPEWDAPSEVTWTIEEARQAKLIKADSNWEKYPRAMLRNRAVAEAARSGFPDICAGLYDPDEVESPDVHIVTFGDVPATARVAPPGEPIDVEGRPPRRMGQPRTPTRREVRDDGAVVDRDSGEVVSQPTGSPDPDARQPLAVQEQTATAIRNHAKFIHLSDEQLGDLIVAELDIPDAAAMTEGGAQYVLRLLTFGRQIKGAQVTSRLDKILADIEADPERERLIDSHWLSELFREKEQELQAKAAGSHGRR